MHRFLVCAVLAACLCGERASATDARPAVLSGSVIRDDTSEPLSRAQILLKPLEAGLNPVAVESNERGRFVFYGLKPGNYSVQVRRDGYLPVSHATRGRFRMPPIFTVEAGSRVHDLTFRLPRWSVIAGKIKFDTGEPGINIAVQLYRQVFVRSRRVFALAANGRTNDLGEYRMSGLAPGEYFVAASYQRALPQDVVEQEPTDEDGRTLPEMSYATTFYPSALKLSDAVPVRVNLGQEVAGVDVFLTPVPTVRIRGRVISGGSGRVLPGGAVSLRRAGASDGSSINVPVIVRPWRDGFEIRGVTSGPYFLLADTEENGVRYSARFPVLVTDAPIDNVELVLAPAREWNVEVRMDAEAASPEMGGLRITLEPRSEMSPIVPAQPDKKGALKAQVSKDETYDVYVANLPPDYYLKSVRIANEDRLAAGVNGSAASATVPLSVVLGANGGRVAGRAYTSDGYPATGANITLVPSDGPSRAQWYRSGSTDEYGVFQIRGLAPGSYTAFAYYDDPPCEFYSREELPACRSKGRDVTVGEAAQAVIELPVAH